MSRYNTITTTPSAASFEDTPTIIGKRHRRGQSCSWPVSTSSSSQSCSSSSSPAVTTTKRSLTPLDANVRRSSTSISTPRTVVFPLTTKQARQGSSNSNSSIKGIPVVAVSGGTSRSRPVYAGGPPSSSSLLASLLHREYRRSQLEASDKAHQAHPRADQPLDHREPFARPRPPPPPPPTSTPDPDPAPSSSCSSPLSTDDHQEVEMIGVVAPMSDDEGIIIDGVTVGGEKDDLMVGCGGGGKDALTECVDDSGADVGSGGCGGGAGERTTIFASSALGDEMVDRGFRRGQRKGPFEGEHGEGDGDSEVSHLSSVVSSATGHQGILNDRSTSTLFGGNVPSLHHPQPVPHHWQQPLVSSFHPHPYAAPASNAFATAPGLDQPQEQAAQSHLVHVVEKDGLYFLDPSLPVQRATLPNGTQGYIYSANYYPSPNRLTRPVATVDPLPQQYTNWFGNPRADQEHHSRSLPQVRFAESSYCPTTSPSPSHINELAVDEASHAGHSPSSLATPDSLPGTSSKPITPEPSPSIDTAGNCAGDTDMAYHNTTNHSQLPDAYPTQGQLGNGMPSYMAANMGGSRAPSNVMMVMEEGEQQENGQVTPVELGEYEKERLANIRNNDMLMQSLGLGGISSQPSTFGSPGGSAHVKRKTSTVNLKANPNERRKKARSRQLSSGPTRASTRIASMSRRVSYADLAGAGSDVSDSGDDSSFSQEGEEEEDDWDGSTQSGDGSRRKTGPRSNAGKHRNWGGGKTKPPKQKTSFNDPTLRDLIDEHPLLRETYPLFYHACTSDMLISNDAFPLIGSVPATSTPVEKADYLRQFYHKGRRCIAQLDAFTARCDKKYAGPGARWQELDYAMKIAIRDIRRKGVERCENYKYTRRDLLNRALGKNKWEPIEDDWISWTPTTDNVDPAGDLEGFVLASPPPRPEVAPPARPDPLMQGLQQPIVQTPRNSRRRSVKVKAEVVDRPTGVQGSNSQRQNAAFASTGGQYNVASIDFHNSSPGMVGQTTNDDADSEIDVDEEEARLEEERQRQLALQQSQQRYDHSGYQMPLQTYGMYSAIRGGDTSSAGSGGIYTGGTFANGNISIAQTAGPSGQHHLNVDVHHAPMSSHSTYSHPLSSTHSHHEMMEQGMGMMSGGIDMNFNHIEGNADVPGMQIQPFNVGPGTIYSNLPGFNASQQEYPGMQGDQWQGNM